MNESHWNHFSGAFFFALVFRQALSPWWAFGVVMALGLGLEYWQWRRSVGRPWLTLDTALDLLADAAGAALACIGAWC